MNQYDLRKDPGRSGGNRTLWIVLLYAAVVFFVIAIPYYIKMVAPWRHTILQVGDISITSRDLIQRLRLHPPSSGINQLETVTALLQEMEQAALIQQEAKKLKFQVPDREIDKEIRERVLASSPGEGKFEELYSALLRRLGLKEKEYRFWVLITLYRQKLLQSFFEKTPDRAEQIRLSVIVLGTAAQAEAVRDRLRKGEDFARLAGETSIDLGTAKKGGEFGWIPKGVDDLITPGQIRAVGILTKTKAEAEQIREMALAGQDIKKLAREYSLDKETGITGGNLGWISADVQAKKPFGPEVYALNPGDMSRPIQSADGFWIVKAIEKSPRGKVIDDIAFQLPPAAVSPPLNTEKGFYILKVQGKEQSPFSPEQRALLSEKALTAWLEAAAQKGRKEGGIKWDWGSETFQWVIKQLN